MSKKAGAIQLNICILLRIPLRIFHTKIVSSRPLADENQSGMLAP